VVAENVFVIVGSNPTVSVGPWMLSDCDPEFASVVTTPAFELVLTALYGEGTAPVL
jgi:hypothetical protein